jgi:ABC-type glycerol-3-phosphate transport system permease component
MDVWNKSVRRWGVFTFLVVVVVVVNIPVIAMVLNSFKSTPEIMSSRQLLPQKFILDNFVFLHNRTDFWLFLRNSMIVSAAGTFFSIVAAALAGYAMSRHRNWLVSAYGRSLLLIQMFPIILAIIPLFVLFVALNMVNTYWSVIAIYTVLHLPFATWMFMAFFDSIPRELEEAAWIDGCSRLRGLIRIVLPLSGPGVAAVSIFSFLFTYNEFLIANVFLRDESVMTVPVGIQMFMQQYTTDWGSLMAASTLAMLPALIVFLFVQKYMVRGMLTGSVKG